MAKYMLLLHDNPGVYQAMSPEEMQRVLEKYMAWGDRLRQAGIMLDGQKLADEPGKVVRGAGARMRVTDGPYSESKEVLGGYYTIAAGTYAEAVERCADCPHLEYGGTIEIREIDNMGQ